MSNHTPGPWIGAGPSFGDQRPKFINEIVTEWEDENGEVITICQLPCDGFDDENEANASLIAAAPDLLDACIAAEKWLSGWASADPYLNIIQAAIAKAKGGAS